MIVIALSLLVVALLAGVVWQHLRYLRARREVVQDKQALFHSGDAFHVVTYLEVPGGADVIEEVRKLRNGIESGGQAKLVWAGQAPFVALESGQLPEASWNAVVLVEYPSREAYDEVAASATYAAAVGRFDRTYSHGMRRWRGLNLAFPAMLLAVRLKQILLREPARFPFTQASEDDMDPRTRARRDRFERFRELKGLSEDAVVVVNLLKHGTPEQQAADSAYGMEMFNLFAEQGHGPMHMGAAVTLEGDAEFDRVAIVYYPGVEYFISMGTSTFFNSIVGGKQPGDTLAVPTVPITSAL